MWHRARWLPAPFFVIGWWRVMVTTYTRGLVPGGNRACCLSTSSHGRFLPEPLWKVVFLHLADSLWREMWRGERTRCAQCSGSCSGGDECEVHCNDVSCVYLMEGSNLQVVDDE